MGPQSLLQMDSHRESELVKDLNLLQVMEKEITESIGSRSKIVKRWSVSMLVIGDEDDKLVMVVSAMEEEVAMGELRLLKWNTERQWLMG